MAGFTISRFASPPSLSGAERGKCPAVRWRDVGESGLRSSIVPLMAKNFPLLLSGHWTHQILQKDALPRWKTFEGIKSVFQGYGLNQLRESGFSEPCFRGDQIRCYVSTVLRSKACLGKVISFEAGRLHLCAMFTTKVAT